MTAIFPPAQKGGVPPGPNVCNGFSPVHPVIGEGPLYVAADCTTYLTDCQLNSLASEILAAVDALDFSFNANRINNLGDALPSKFAALQAALDAKIARAGDTMTGPLEVPCPPANDNEAACKKYVDETLDNCCGDVRNHVDNIAQGLQTQINGKVNRDGDWMTGALLLSGDPTLPGHAVTKNYVDNLFSEIDLGDLETGLNNRVLRSGDTMTGPLILSEAPTLPMQAATKHYVDMHAGAVIVSPVTPGGIARWPGRLWWNSASGRLYVFYDDGDMQQWVGVTAAESPGGVAGDFLPIGGGTLTGPLMLHADPAIGGQAATKHYVDSQIALGGTFIDAAADGQLWARKNNAWATVPIDEDAPDDGELYARQNNSWVSFAISTDGGTY